MKAKFLSACGAVLLTLIALELVLRWWFPFAPGPRDADAGTLLHRRSPNSRLIYELAPNFNRHAPQAGAHIRTNSFGYRDIEWPLEKPADVKRIVLVGDSSAFGWNIEAEKRYSNLTERILNEKSGEMKFEVLNMAVGGYDSSQSVEAALSRGLRFSPDVIVVPYFLNDDVIGADNHLYWYYASSGSKAIDFWILLLKSAWYQYFEDLTLTAYKRLKVGLTGRDIQVIVLIFPAQDTSGAARYSFAARHDEIRGYCDELNFVCIDLYEDFARVGFADLLEDTVHPSEAGHRLVAEILASRIFMDMQ